MKRIVKESDNQSLLKTDSGTTKMQIAELLGNQAVMQMYSDIVQLALIPLKQDGCNCGMYALAMALQEFIGIVNIEEEGKGVAKQLQGFAVTYGYSNLGEMFDADNLALVGNAYLKHFDLAFLCKCITVGFDTKDQLRFLLKKNKENKIRILFPYAANEDITPDTEGERLSPDEMYKAHWSVINSFEETGKTWIFEGNKIMNNQHVTLENLYKSNQKLGDEFDWRGYDRTVKAGFLAPEKQKGSNDYSERVNLRGKVVFVGKSSDVDTAIADYESQKAGL